MSEQLLYAAILRGGTPLYEARASRLSEELTKSRVDVKKTYDHQGHSFVIQYKDGLAFICVTPGGNVVPYSEGGDVNAGLQQLFRKYQARDADKITKIQDDLQAVKGVMSDNIDKVMERETKLNDLLDQTDSMKSTSERFQRGSSQLRRTMWWKNVKIQIAIAVFVVLLIIILVLAFCGITFSNCRSSGTS